jgi:hypothetical protein
MSCNTPVILGSLHNAALLMSAAIDTSDSVTYYDLVDEYGDRFLLPDQVGALVHLIAVDVLARQRQYDQARNLVKSYDIAETDATVR